MIPYSYIPSYFLNMFRDMLILINTQIEQLERLKKFISKALIQYFELTCCLSPSLQKSNIVYKKQIVQNWKRLSTNFIFDSHIDTLTNLPPQIPKFVA